MRALLRWIQWLGPARAWTLFGLTAGTGLLSLIFQAVFIETAASWAIPAQNILLAIWLVSMVGIIIGRFEPQQRQVALFTFGPLLVTLVLGLVFPALFPWFFGAGVGWLLVAQLMARRNVRREYKEAIRHLRRSEYGQAIQIMNGLIKVEGSDSSHYNFRAKLHRLNRDLRRAIKDYQKIVELEPESGVGYNGLSEVYLQENQLEEALKYAQLAYEREPGHWVASYNLGMIEDRLGLSDVAIDHLQTSLALSRIPSRHRLLIHLWLARAYMRLGQADDARSQLARLRHEKPGLREWTAIFASDQAETLRAVLAEDVSLAQRITEGAGLEVFGAAESQLTA